MTKRIGSVVVIEPEEDAVCEQCGKLDELRPYGKRMESGRRLRICFDCAMKDEPGTAKAYQELFE